MHEDLVLRPDRRKGLMYLCAAAALSVAVVASAAVGAGGAAALAAAVPFGAMLAFGAGHIHRDRVVLTEQEVVTRGLVLQRRRARSRVAEVVRATLVAHRGSPGDTLFLLDARRAVLFRLPAAPTPAVKSTGW
ncbi:hypothetical protein [Streptomonospora arabica]|uniref:DUF2244 domain-containing protein n=1 Tax=Streptomonospora arabica TaxID=412417 RepID=A0ABV9SU80_9ACTN